MRGPKGEVVDFLCVLPHHRVGALQNHGVSAQIKVVNVRSRGDQDLMIAFVGEGDGINGCIISESA